MVSFPPLPPSIMPKVDTKVRARAPTSVLELCRVLVHACASASCTSYLAFLSASLPATLDTESGRGATPFSEERRTEVKERRESTLDEVERRSASRCLPNLDRATTAASTLVLAGMKGVTVMFTHSQPYSPASSIATTTTAITPPPPPPLLLPEEEEEEEDEEEEEGSGISKASKEGSSAAAQSCTADAAVKTAPQPAASSCRAAMGEEEGKVKADTASGPPSSSTHPKRFTPNVVERAVPTPGWTEVRPGRGGTLPTTSADADEKLPV
mmetsp:Transcript_41446/g.107388  ORF Transcript_41446/g.107388 Transcript_41446/m.107388 type:complete len:269 (-) Transcript_41446:1204-2010(-)